MRSHRFPITVLFTDMVGSTERAAALGDHSWGELLARYHAEVRAEIRRFGGHEVNMVGDGFVATFEAPAAAIHSAWAIRAVVRELGLEVRSGIHAGEVEGRGKDLQGIAVHIGARVAAAARHGQILVTSTVRELVTGTGFGFEDQGEVVLKGVPGAWRLFALTSPPARAAFRTGRWVPEISARQAKIIGGAALGVVALGLVVVAVVGDIAKRAPPRAGTPAEHASIGAGPGVAIVPFRVTDPEFDLWREGMVDLLSTNLDGAGGLRAIDSRTIMARWREAVPEGSDPDLATTLAVARRANARYVLVGSVVGDESRLQLTANVYAAATGERLGQARVVGLPDSLFALVDQLSVQSLRVMLGSGESELPKVWNLRSITTSSLEALKEYLEGEVLYRNARFEEASTAYERAVSADSTFALALYRLASTYGWLENIGSATPGELFERALRFADRLPTREAVFVRANYALHLGTLEGIGPLQRAVQLYPDDPEGWWLLGDTYQHLGQQALVEEALVDQTLMQAVRLAPDFSPYYIHLVERAVRQERRDQAALLTERYRGLASGSPTDRRNRLAFALAFGDSMDRARAVSMIDTVPSDVVWSAAGFYLSDAYHADVKETVLRRVRSRFDARPVAANVLFFFLLNRGRLRDAYEEAHDPLLSRGLKAYALYALFSRGLPLTEDQWDVLLGTLPSDTLPELDSFYAGAYTATRARWSDHAAAVNMQRAHSERLRAAADTVGARFYQATAQALEGFGLWRQGRRNEALSLLVTAQRLATGSGERNRVNATIRTWLGELLVELGRVEEATRFYESQWEDAYSASQLARTYESLGERSKAMKAHEYVISMWQDADPELAPSVVDARRFLASAKP